MRGRLELHYDARTVTLDDINGDVAMRASALVTRFDPGDPSSTAWSDYLDPETADAFDGWLSLELTRTLATRWRPERFRRTDIARTAVRLLNADPDKTDVSSWSPENLHDYLAVAAHLADDIEDAELADDRPPASDNGSEESGDTAAASEAIGPEQADG